MSRGLLPVRAWGHVVENRQEVSHWRLVLRVPDWPGAEAGQFVMLSAGALGGVPRSDPLLPRPMAVYRTRAEGEIEILYKVVGRGTALLADALPGQALRVVGPLGVAFPEPPRSSRAILVGGGTGIASLYQLAAGLAGQHSVSVLLGARTGVELMGRADFEALEVGLSFATDDGSEGKRGLVTALLADALEEHVGVEVSVYSCGPTAMMALCAQLSAEHKVSCTVSLENNMACGFGVCLGCAVPLVRGAYSLVCRAGPVFDASEIAWEELA